MKYSILSIALSIFVIFLGIQVNITIANEFLKATGKTKALFWLVELGYSFKYYFLIGSLVSGILLFKAFREKEKRKVRIVGLVLLLIGIISIVLRLWTWFIRYSR